MRHYTRPGFAEPPGVASGREMMVRLEHVARLYRVGDVTVSALVDVNLEVPAGQFVAILGPSGSGKTTLLNVVGGIDRCSSGRIWVNGQEITALDERLLTIYRRTQVGFVFQFFNLVPTLTARENVEMVAELVGNQGRVEDALWNVGLGDRADHFPGQLSGGEQQRVAIARALAKAPRMLLCDEPTGELDFETGKLILGAIRRINQTDGTTVVVVTHNTAIGKMADRVVRMRSGGIVEDRPVESPISPDELEW